jgi:hypothetical protein
MKGREKPHTDKYKAITNDWNYDTSCTLTSLPVWYLEKFKRLVFVVQSVQGIHVISHPPKIKNKNYVTVHIGKANVSCFSSVIQICLQFPDALLHDSVEVALCLGKLLGSIPYILGDTSYGR